MWEALADLGIDATTSIIAIDHALEKSLNAPEHLLDASSSILTSAKKNKILLNSITPIIEQLQPSFRDSSEPLDSMEVSIQTIKDAMEPIHTPTQDSAAPILTLNTPRVSFESRILSVGLTTLIPRYRDPYHSSTNPQKSLLSSVNPEITGQAPSIQSNIIRLEPLTKLRTRKQDFNKEHLVLEEEYATSNKEHPETVKSLSSEDKPAAKQIYYLTLGDQENTLGK